VACIGSLSDITDRRLAEQALETEAIRRRALFDQSPVGIVVIDTETARFLEFNTLAHRQLGYSRDEFASLAIPDVEAIETAAETHAHIQTVMRDGYGDFETLQRTRHGELRDVRVIAQVVNVQGKNLYYCIWNDITEQKQMQAALLDARAQLALALPAAGLGSWSLSLLSMRGEWDEAAAALLGYGRTAFPAAWGEWERLVHPDDLDAFRVAFRSLQAGELSLLELDLGMRHVSGELRRLRLAGMISQRDSSGRPRRLAGTLRAI
jgi:PAS domain S-box-containing protein